MSSQHHEWEASFKASLQAEVTGRIKASTAENREDVWTIKKAIDRTAFERTFFTDSITREEYVALFVADVLTRVVCDPALRDARYAVTEASDALYSAIVDLPRGV